MRFISWAYAARLRDGGGSEAAEPMLFLESSLCDANRSAARAYKGVEGQRLSGTPETREEKKR